MFYSTAIMPSPNDITFIIPVYDLKEDRIENLKFILPYIQSTGCRILVVEQIENDTSNLFEILSKFSKVEHILFKTPEKRFHKTGIINHAVLQHVHTKYAWVNDVDYYMRFKSVFEHDWTASFIQPYEIAKKLNQRDSDIIRSGKKLDVNFSDDRVKYISMYGALSFIFEVSTFISMGAMDESIYGWGYEDMELAKRVNEQSKVQKIDIKGIHLWHPTELEKKKDMAVVTCHFNWCNYKNTAKNLNRFIRNMELKSVPLFGIELSETDKFVTVGLEGWTQILISKENVCFQKEACINLAVQELVPKSYKKIAWIDADLEFLNANWYDEASKALDEHKLIQLYSNYLYTDENEKVVGNKNSIMKNCGVSGEIGLTGLPGGAWAALRELWNNGGLYPYCFVGGGDVAFIASVLGFENQIPIRNIIGIYGKNENCEKFQIWKAAVTKYIDKKVACLDGDVIHGWHGEFHNRKYNHRWNIYSDINIDNNVSIGEKGLIEFSNVSQEFYKKINSYFRNRKEDGESQTSNKIVVYTCITGGYDYLKEIQSPNPNIDYVCFSDKPITSKTWKIKEIPGMLNLLSKQKIARCLKIMPHLFLSEYDVSVWIDGSIEVLRDTNEFISKSMNGYFSISKHPLRNCIYEEAVAVLHRQKDLADTVVSQILRYKELGYPKNHGLIQSGIIVRKHNTIECKKLCEDWWKEVLVGSCRDQLSFNFVIWNKLAKIEVFDPIEFSGKYFQLWKHSNAEIEKFKQPLSEVCIKNYIDGIKV